MVGSCILRVWLYEALCSKEELAGDELAERAKQARRSWRSTGAWRRPSAQRRSGTPAALQGGNATATGAVAAVAAGAAEVVAAAVAAVAAGAAGVATSVGGTRLAELVMF